MSLSKKLASPLHASTVILLKDDHGHLEIYLLEKSRSLEFAGGAYVFPGGTVKEEDANADWFSRFPHLSPDTLHETIPDVTRKEALGFYVSALRELLEEAGILLASCAVSPGEKNTIRSALLQGESFLSLAAKFDLTLSPELLVYYSHWVTPEVYPIRFSARFFLARLPDGQTPSPDGHEVLKGVWMSPGQALEQTSSGSLPLMTPTLITLQELSHFSSAEEALAWGKKRVKIPRRPWVDGQGRIHLS